MRAHTHTNTHVDSHTSTTTQVFNIKAPEHHTPSHKVVLNSKAATKLFEDIVFNKTLPESKAQQHSDRHDAHYSER